MHIFLFLAFYHIKGSDAQAHNNIIRTTKLDSYTNFVKDIGSTLMLLCNALKYNLLPIKFIHEAFMNYHLKMNGTEHKVKMS